MAQMNNGRYQESVILSPEYVTLMHKPGLNNYGMGWYIGQDGEIEHGGHLECFGAHLYIDTKNQRGIALLFNVNRGEGNRHLYLLVPAIAKLLAGGAALIPPTYTGNRESLMKLLGALCVIGIWFGWSWHLWLFLILPLLLECLLVVVLIVMLPVAISVAFLYSPDAMWLWLLTIIVTTGWGLFRTLWIIGLVRKRKGTGFDLILI
jgi:hypothetical protein